MSDEEFRFEPGDLVDVQGPGGHYEWAHIEGIMPLHVVVIYLLTGTVGSVPRANLRAPMQLFPSEAEAEAALKAAQKQLSKKEGKLAKAESQLAGKPDDEDKKTKVTKRKEGVAVARRHYLFTIEAHSRSCAMLRAKQLCGGLPGSPIQGFATDGSHSNARRSLSFDRVAPPPAGTPPKTAKEAAAALMTPTQAPAPLAPRVGPIEESIQKVWIETEGVRFVPETGLGAETSTNRGHPTGLQFDPFPPQKDGAKNNTKVDRGILAVPPYGDVNHNPIEALIRIYHLARFWVDANNLTTTCATLQLADELVINKWPGIERTVLNMDSIFAILNEEIVTTANIAKYVEIARRPVFKVGIKLKRFFEDAIRRYVLVARLLDEFTFANSLAQALPRHCFMTTANSLYTRLDNSSTQWNFPSLDALCIEYSEVLQQVSAAKRNGKGQWYFEEAKPTRSTQEATASFVAPAAATTQSTGRGWAAAKRGNQGGIRVPPKPRGKNERSPNTFTGACWACGGPHRLPECTDEVKKAELAAKYPNGHPGKRKFKKTK